MSALAQVIQLCRFDKLFECNYEKSSNSVEFVSFEVSDRDECGGDPRADPSTRSSSEHVMASESSSSESVGKEYVKWHSPNIGRDMEINICELLTAMQDAFRNGKPETSLKRKTTFHS